MADPCGCRVESEWDEQTGNSYWVRHCPRHAEAHVAALITERDGWKHRADSIETQRDDYWRQKIANLEAHVLQIETMLSQSARRVVELERRLHQLEGALEKYGQHLDSCDWVDDTGCDCGLDALQEGKG